MKIKILTLPLIVNYGGILQAFALQTVLQRMGHEVSVIDYDRKPKLIEWIWKVPGRLWKKYVLRRSVPVFHEKLEYRLTTAQARYTSQFIERNIQRRLVRSLSELRKEEMDALVIGSDQIWRPAYFTYFYGNICNAFGAFANNWNICRMSYAASFGVDHLNEYKAEELEQIRNILSTFSGVSVRESSGVKLCEDNFHVSALHVLDPTMLLDKEDYIRLIPDSIPVRRGIMTYVLDDFEGKDEFLNRLSEREQLPLFSVIANSYKDVQPPLEEWLAGFRDASLIVTDSFHACVFSILFNKPFWVLLNPARGVARIESLLTMFGLKERILYFNHNNINENSPINWDEVNKKLKKWKQLSLVFLDDTLN